MHVYITMSTEPHWVRVLDAGEAGADRPGFPARSTWQVIERGEAFRAHAVQPSGVLASDERLVVLNPAHVVSLHEVPPEA